jgi:Ni,Fe-hydrogenase maturation factor
LWPRLRRRWPFPRSKANFGGRPGEIVRLGAAEIPACPGLKLSEHQVTFREVLGLMELMAEASAAGALWLQRLPI